MTILSKVAGREIRYVPVSDDDMRQSLSSAGWSPEQADFMVGLFFAVREGWAESVTPEVSSILGRAPITFEQFTQDVAATFNR